jgi:hypothetical protein
LITLVEVPGPPWVITYTVSNTWNDPITSVTSTNSMVELSSGSVILVNRRNADAPSMAAAS